MGCCCGKEQKEDKVSLVTNYGSTHTDQNPEVTNVCTQPPSPLASHLRTDESRSVFSEEDQALESKAQDAATEGAALLGEEHWLGPVKHERDMQLWRASPALAPPRGVSKLRCQGVVYGVSSSLLPVLCQDIEFTLARDRRGELRELRVVDRVGDKCEVRYEVVKYPDPVGCRDRCFLVTWRLEAGRTLCIEKSVEHPRCPESEYPRVNALTTYVFEDGPPSTRGETTRMTIATQFDMGSRVPKPVLENMLENIRLTCMDISKFVESAEGKSLILSIERRLQVSMEVNEGSPEIGEKPQQLMRPTYSMVNIEDLIQDSELQERVKGGVDLANELLFNPNLFTPTCEVKRGVKVWKVAKGLNIGNNVQFKWEGTVVGADACSLSRLLKQIEFLLMTDKKKEIVELRTLETVSEGCEIRYQVDRLPWPLSNRDRCFFTLLKQLPDGRALIVDNSIPSHPGCPNSDCVRLNFIATLLLEDSPLPDGSLATKLTIATRFDIGGRVPKSLLEAFVGEKCEIFNDLTAFLSREDGRAQLAKANSEPL